MVPPSYPQSKKIPITAGLGLGTALPGLPLLVYRALIPGWESGANSMQGSGVPA